MRQAQSLSKADRLFQLNQLFRRFDEYYFFHVFLFCFYYYFTNPSLHCI